MNKDDSTFSLERSEESLRFLEDYAHRHGLHGPGEALERAVRALRVLELAEGYRLAAQDHQHDPDPLVDSDVGDSLEPDDGREWL